MTLRAIVFDFDGVIADSEPLHFGAYRDVLREQGLELTEHDYYTRYLGYDDVGAFRAIAANRGLAASAGQIAEWVARKAARLEVLERDVSVLFPGAEDAIRRAAEAVPLAIASGALREEIVRVLARANLLGCFAAIVAAEDTATSKPAPDPYVRALASLSTRAGDGLLPHECVAIEDSRWGLESARAAGLRTVAVAQTYDRAALGAADLVIPDLRALDITELKRLCSQPAIGYPVLE